MPPRSTALPPQASTQTAVGTTSSKGKGKARTAAQSSISKPAQQEQLYNNEDDDIEKIVRPSGEAGSRKKGFILIEAMKLDNTPQRQQLYNRIQASVRRRIIQAQLEPDERFASQDSDKIRSIVHLLRNEYQYLCQARFPGGWPVVEMIKSNLRNARKYRRRKQLAVDLDSDIGDGQEDEGSDGNNSNIDPELWSEATPVGDIVVKRANGGKRKHASTGPVDDNQAAEAPTKRARNTPTTTCKTRTQSTRAQSTRAQAARFKPLSTIPHFEIPGANHAPTEAHNTDRFAAAEDQELDDDPEADENEEEDVGSNRVVIRSADGHVIYAPNSDEEDDGDGDDNSRKSIHKY
ncbi:hypothetical protein EST38_g13449 [Candolleomyces aberdarensis]|uniref:Uncharacterized protein n=1 Tax=Candolleomyces aberdarensis TaxID=2316362 RepID=A0A4Q2CZW7_9AGAR|nr:hypothetical protein EST38_g13449 [Candolleomyces aberdarensis]